MAGVGANRIIRRRTGFVSGGLFFVDNMRGRAFARFPLDRVFPHPTPLVPPVAPSPDTQRSGRARLVPCSRGRARTKPNPDGSPVRSSFTVATRDGFRPGHLARTVRNDYLGTRVFSDNSVGRARKSVRTYARAYLLSPYSNTFRDCREHVSTRRTENPLLSVRGRGAQSFENW